MLNFLIRRLLISAFLVFCISLVSFFMITLAPGSPYPWGELNPKITPQVKEAFRKKFHLDRPLHEQYWLNMRDLFSGELRSIKDDRPVLGRILERLPATVTLNVAAMALSLTFGLLIGIHCARHAGKPRDTAVSFAVFVFIAVPTFWIGVLLITAFAVTLQWLPSGGFPVDSWRAFGEAVRSMILPAITLALAQGAVLMRYARSATIDALNTEWFRTARATGMSTRTALRVHGLRNVLSPVVSVLGVQLATQQCE